MTSAAQEKYNENIALSLSGGGSRAIAFHLGCLRALNSVGMLQKISIISSVSGGSVIAALYCHHQGNFDSFDEKVCENLRKGFVWPALKEAAFTTEGLKAVASFVPLFIERFFATIIRNAIQLFWPESVAKLPWLTTPFFTRWASRTTILESVLNNVFNNDSLLKLRSDRPKLVVVACELQTKSAFYFSVDSVGSYKLGKASPSKVSIARAVVCSAAFPIALPAIEASMDFEKDGVSSTKRAILTDGGVYDNLGLAPLWPDRDPSISLNVGEYDRIIACRAGYGSKHSPVPVFWLSRMYEMIECIHTRTQNYATGRLFDLKNAGKLKGFLLPYLGQEDRNLSFKPDNFITVDMIADYPTNFRGMSEKWINLLSLRGEQLTLALLKEHWSEKLV